MSLHCVVIVYAKIVSYDVKPTAAPTKLARTGLSVHMLGDKHHSQPCTEKSAQCSNMTTAINGQNTCI